MLRQVLDAGGSWTAWYFWGSLQGFTSNHAGESIVVSGPRRLYGYPASPRYIFVLSGGGKAHPLWPLIGPYAHWFLLHPSVCVSPSVLPKAPRLYIPQRALPPVLDQPNTVHFVSFLIFYEMPRSLLPITRNSPPPKCHTNDNSQEMISKLIVITYIQHDNDAASNNSAQTDFMMKLYTHP